MSVGIYTNTGSLQGGTIGISSAASGRQDSSLGVFDVSDACLYLDVDDLQIVELVDGHEVIVEIDGDELAFEVNSKDGKQRVQVLIDREQGLKLITYGFPRATPVMKLPPILTY